MSRRAVFLLSLLVVAGAVLALLVRSGGKQSTARPAYAGNLILVTVDTLRADHVGAYGWQMARTPTLDGLARSGVRFDQAFAPAPITLPSHASLLTGRYPPAHGARHNGIPVDASMATLATALRGAGFSTAAFVAAFPLDHRFGLDRGFDVYSDRMPRGADGRPLNERPAAQVVDEAVAWLGAHSPARFFLWVHLFEPHAPYGAPDPTGLQQRPPAERYDEEIAVADREIGRLLETARRLAPDTLIVAAGDHGEAFGEHGEIAHSIFVYDVTLRVPLLFSGPALKPAVVTAPVSLIDVVPTTLALLGAAPMATDGVDLGAAMRGADVPRRELYAESFAPLFDFGWSSLRALRSGPWKFIDAPRPELYNVTTDPAETVDLVARQPVLARGFEERIARYSGAEPPSRQPPVDPQALARLRALGYAAGRPPEAPSGRRPDPKDRRALAEEIARVTSGELHGGPLQSALERIVRQDPANAQAHLRLGYVLLEQGRCDRATSHFTAAIEQRLPSADPYLGLAMCQGARGDLTAAERTLAEAAVVEPGNPVVLADRAILRLKAGRLDDAIALFREALAIEPDLHEARFNLARAYARAGRRAEAADEAAALLARLPPAAPQRAEVQRLLDALK